MAENAYYTYILECADGSFYTGWTDDVQRRLNAHNEGKGARYTRARLPVRVAATWNFATKKEAMSFEWRVKQMSRQKKSQLIREGILEDDFS